MVTKKEIKEGIIKRLKAYHLMKVGKDITLYYQYTGSGTGQVCFTHCGSALQSLSGEPDIVEDFFKNPEKFLRAQQNKIKKLESKLLEGEEID